MSIGDVVGYTCVLSHSDSTKLSLFNKNELNEIQLYYISFHAINLFYIDYHRILDNIYIYIGLYIFVNTIRFVAEVKPLYDCLCNSPEHPYHSSPLIS